MIIDIHTHIFHKNVIQNKKNYLDDRTFSFLYSSEKAGMIDHETMLESMDESGIDYVAAMGFPWNEEKYCREQNVYFKEVMGLSENRIVPFGSVPLNEDADIEKHVKEIKEMGLAGIGEIAFYAEGMNNKNGDLLRRIFKAAEKYSLPVNLHVNEPVGHDYPGKYNSDLNLLYPILLEYPDVPIILGHWGGGLFFYELMPEINKAFSNIYYDTAASPFLFKEDIYDIAIRIMGPDRILFGSDFPLIKFKRYLDSIKKSVRSRKDREKIIGKNAALLLNIPG